MLQQGCLPFLSDSFDGVEGGSNLAFAAFVAVEGDGKTVYLVLDIFQQVKEGSVLLDADIYRRKAEQDFRSTVAVVLCQTCDGNVQSEFVFDDLS